MNLFVNLAYYYRKNQICKISGELAMILLSLEEVNLTSNYRIFKQSAITQLIFLLIILAIMGGTGWFILKKEPSGVEIFFFAIFQIFWLFFAIIVFSSFKKSLAKTNWLLAIGLSNVYVKFRSYLNAELPENDKQVVSFSCSEIKSVNITKQRIISYGSGNSTSTSFHTFLDINFHSADLSRLKEQIKQERQKRITKKHSSYKTNHYPVAVVDEDTVRIEWRSPTDIVVPGIKKVLAAFEQYNITIAPKIKEVIDTTGSDRKDKAKAEDNIIHLAERGNIIAATKLARKTYKMSLADAREFVEGLLK